jgi:DnaK suppressor protein
MALSAEDVRYFERRLRARRDELVDILRAELRASKSEQYADLAGEVHDDVGDRSVAELLRDMAFSGRERESDELRDVAEALERIRQGTYGLCVDNRAEIPRERLEAYPTAKRCLQCQQRYERRIHGATDASPSL